MTVLRSAERQPCQWSDVVRRCDGESLVSVHMLVAIFVIRWFVSVLSVCLLINILLFFLSDNPKSASNPLQSRQPRTHLTRLSQ